MRKIQEKARKRINVILPQDTISLIDQVAEAGARSNLINEAVRFYIGETGKANLRKQLREGALRNADRDLRLSANWFSVGEEAWQDI